METGISLKFKLMNIGSRYHGASYKGLYDFQVKKVGKYFESLSKYVQKGVGLYIWGENGVGKSYIAAALCRSAWDLSGVFSYCVTASELKEAWISDRPVYDGSEQTVIGRSNNVKFLVIDDLGKEHRTSTGFAQNKFEELIRHRTRHLLTTVITSNIPFEEVDDFYSESIYDLFLESCIEINLVGDSQRVKSKRALKMEFSDE